MRRRAKAFTAGSTKGSGHKARGLFGLVCVCVVGLAAFLGSGAPSAGAAEAFPGQGFLPDNRAWEMVSPPDKNGGDVMADSSRTRAAVDGNAASFSSLQGFADVRGMSIGTDYIAQRDPGSGDNGWVTHGITPPQEPLSLFAAFQAFDPLYEGALSADLSSGVFRAWSPVLGAEGADPNVASVENLYVRDDLRSPGAGSYALASPCPFCAAPLAPPDAPAKLPRLAGTSTDFRRILFESRYRLTADAPTAATAPKLYKWFDGTLSYAGLPNARAIAGQSAGAATGGPRYTMRVITADGSRNFFTVGTSNSATSGALWMQDDLGTANPSDDVNTQINSLAGESGAGVGSAVATYQTASTGVDAEGSRIPVRAFFISSQQLTADDTDAEADLYMYTEGPDPSSEANLTRLSVDGEPADEPGGARAVIGTSEDGTYVYYLAVGQLVSGKPVLMPDRGIYVWHEGANSFVGPLLDPGDEIRNAPTDWLLSPLRSRVTPDGKHLLFVSQNGEDLLSLRGGDDYDQTGCHGLCQELYLYSAADDRLACASCNPNGPATASVDITARSFTGAASPTFYVNHALSADGRYVFFSSPEKLVPQDANSPCPPPVGLEFADCTDVYEYDSLTGEFHLLSDGKATSPAVFLDASADGSDVFFMTSRSLSRWDVNYGFDLYDARAGGGIAEPPVSAAACQGDSCQPLPSQPGDLTSPGSMLVQGPGDPPGNRATSHRCAKGKYKRKRNGKGRCVGRKAAGRGGRPAQVDRRAAR